VHRLINRVSSFTSVEYALCFAFRDAFLRFCTVYFGAGYQRSNLNVMPPVSLAVLFFDRSSPSAPTFSSTRNNNHTVQVAFFVHLDFVNEGR